MTGRGRWYVSGNGYNKAFIGARITCRNRAVPPRHSLFLGDLNALLRLRHNDSRLSECLSAIRCSAHGWQISPSPAWRGAICVEHGHAVLSGSSPRRLRLRSWNGPFCSGAQPVYCPPVPFCFGCFVFASRPHPGSRAYRTRPARRKALS